MPSKNVSDPIKELAKSVDIKTVNTLLSNTELKDFEMNKSTIFNIAEWCLNGESDNEIRQRLALNKHFDVLLLPSLKICDVITLPITSVQPSTNSRSKRQFEQ